MAPFAIPGWTWPSGGAAWLAFLAIGVFGWGAHQVLIIAHRYAPASTLAPISYAQMLYMIASSWLIFAQPPDGWVLGRRRDRRGERALHLAPRARPRRRRAPLVNRRPASRVPAKSSPGGNRDARPQDRSRHRRKPGDRGGHRRAFARAGHEVVLAARDAGKLTAVVDGLGDGGAASAAVPCDVTDPASVEALFARIAELHGRLDVVFNNAGTNVATTLSAT